MLIWSSRGAGVMFEYIGVAGISASWRLNRIDRGEVAVGIRQRVVVAVEKRGVAMSGSDPNTCLRAADESVAPAPAS